MDDMITIFVKGGEYVDKAAYIQQRTEAGRLREEGVNKDAEVERLRKEVAYNRKDMHALRDECRRLEGHNAKLQAVVDAARDLLAGGDKLVWYEPVYHLEKALAALENDDD